MSHLKALAIGAGLMIGLGLLFVGLMALAAWQPWLLALVLLTPVAWVLGWVVLASRRSS